MITTSTLLILFYTRKNNLNGNNSNVILFCLSIIIVKNKGSFVAAMIDILKEIVPVLYLEWEMACSGWFHKSHHG